VLDFNRWVDTVTEEVVGVFVRFRAPLQLYVAEWFTMAETC
jgi:hypothetical protein